jgi:hypothetical protein
MCCVYDGLEPHNQYEPQQDTKTIQFENYEEMRMETGVDDEAIIKHFRFTEPVIPEAPHRGVPFRDSMQLIYLEE